MATRQPQDQPGDHQYITETFQYITTVKDFCDREGEWISKRESEIDKMTAPQSCLDKCLLCIGSNKPMEELEEVLKNTLEGLEDFQHFLDAVEKLAVTSTIVGEGFPLEGMNTGPVRSVILAARTVSLLLVHLKRDQKVFFKPELGNVDLLVHQLHKYICITKWLCRDLRSMNILQVTQIQDLRTSSITENDLARLSRIRMDGSFRMAFLVDAEEFTKTYSACHPEVSKSLSHLEKTANRRDRMTDCVRVLIILGSYIGYLGGVMSLTGMSIFPARMTLTLTELGGMLGATSGLFSLLTTIIDFVANNCFVKQAKNNMNNLTKNRQKVVDCLEQVVSSWCPAPLLDMGHFELGFMKAIKYCRAVSKSFDSIMDADIVVEKLGINSLGTYVFIGVNIASLIGDVVLFSKETVSIIRREKSNESQLIRSRTALWRSEMEVWERINDCLGKDKERFEKNKSLLEGDLMK